MDINDNKVLQQYLLQKCEREIKKHLRLFGIKLPQEINIYLNLENTQYTLGIGFFLNKAISILLY